MDVKEFCVEKEFEKNPEFQRDCLKNLREWVEGQPHLPSEQISDLDLTLACHSCYFDWESTIRAVDLNFTMRTHYSFYRNRSLNAAVERALNTWLMTPLKNPTKKGYRAVYCELLVSDPESFIYADVVRAFVMMLDLWQYEEGSCSGVVIILNMAQVSLSHVARIDLTVAQEFFSFLQEAMFVRLKEFHFINAPAFIDKVTSMIKPFLKADLLSMVKIHPFGSSSLEEYISKDALPTDMKVLRDQSIQRFKANGRFFEMESKKRADETKRVGGLSAKDLHLCGLGCNFKILEID